MSNECPKCGKEAMSAMHKIMMRPHICQHCGTEVRMNLVFTGILCAVYFGIAVRTLMVTGLNARGMLYVLLIKKKPRPLPELLEFLKACPHLSGRPLAC
jgi:hypothetical protein